MQLETVSVLENETGKLYKLEVTGAVEFYGSRIIKSYYGSTENVNMLEANLSIMSAAVIVYGLIEHSKTDVKGAIEAATDKFTLVELEEGDEAETLGPLALKTRNAEKSAV